MQCSKVSSSIKVRDEIVKRNAHDDDRDDGDDAVDGELEEVRLPTC